MPKSDKSSVELQIDLNDTYGAYQTMHSLNQIIHGLWVIADTRYALSYVFNAGTDNDKQISDIMSENEIISLAETFEHIRAIVISAMLTEYTDNFVEFEKLILNSVWEQDSAYNNEERKVENQKRKVVEQYNDLCKAKEELEQFYQTRFKEDIQK